MRIQNINLLLALSLAIALTGAGCGKSAVKDADGVVKPGAEGRTSSEVRRGQAEHAQKFAKAEELRVRISSKGFETSSLKMKRGGAYRVTLNVTDGSEHTIRIPKFSIAVVANAKSGDLTYDLLPTEAGTFEMYCDTHKGEKATIVVE